MTTTTDTQPTTNTGTFTILAADWHRLIKTALVYASKDTTLPMICAVKLERHGKELVAITTDRFRMGITRVPITDATIPDDWEATISRDNLTRMLPAIKPPTRNPIPPTITFDVELIDNTKIGWAASLGTTGTIEVMKSDTPFPRWRNLIEPGLNDESIEPLEETGGLVVNAAYLADFAKASWNTRGDTITIGTRRGAANKPIIVRVGSHFLGLIMPVRQPEEKPGGIYVEGSVDSELRADWAALVGGAR